MYFVSVGILLFSKPKGLCSEKEVKEALLYDIIPNGTFFGTFVSDIAVSLMEVNALHY